MSHIKITFALQEHQLSGRLPVITYLNLQDATTLRSILTEPKNSLVKQFNVTIDYAMRKFSNSKLSLLKVA